MIQTNPSVLPIIGLEIHVELATETKMFCRCRNRFGDPPNTNVCPVCTGLPGTLPVMNKKAVEYAMRVGMALDCTVPDFTKWDRKSYYYPDLPKDYQISQYDLPLNANGKLAVPLPDGSTKTVRILRAHLEEDAGKNVHDNPAHTGIDLNRAGVPLLEIVSEPDMNSPEEALAYGRAMQRLVRWLGVSEANMQMGHMRFEPNINLHITHDGAVYKTPIVEVKNLNSFRALEAACSFEIQRQLDAWNADHAYTLENRGKQNRGYDDDRGITVFQRGKEEAHDYRYFPDPDLVPVRVDDAWRSRIAEQIGELPLARRRRFMDTFALGFKEADALTQDPESGDLLDAAVAKGAKPARVCNFLLGRIAAEANARGCSLAGVGIEAEQLAETARMTDAGQINATAAGKILEILIESGGRPRQIAESQGLLATTDPGQLEEWVDQAIQNNPDAVAQVTEGGKKQKKAFGYLMGQVMQASRGTAPPGEVQKLLRGKLQMD
jgi:aspartyl-tRNA(Asn)/glutamyl-tRNA(Gln) amidotransferase subunit B